MGEFIRILLELFAQYFIPWVTVYPDQQGVRYTWLPFRLARWRTLAPGFHFYVPVFQKIDTYFVTYQEIDCHLQSLTTADGKRISISCNVGYEVEDAGLMATKVENFDGTLERAARVHLFAIVQKLSLEELRANLRGVQGLIRKALDKQTTEWGVKVKRVGFTDLAETRMLRIHNDAFTTILPTASPLT